MSVFLVVGVHGIDWVHETDMSSPDYLCCPPFTLCINNCIWVFNPMLAAKNHICKMAGGTSIKKEGGRERTNEFLFKNMNGSLICVHV